MYGLSAMVFSQGIEFDRECKTCNIPSTKYINIRQYWK